MHNNNNNTYTILELFQFFVISRRYKNIKNIHKTNVIFISLFLFRLHTLFLVWLYGLRDLTYRISSKPKVYKKNKKQIHSFILFSTRYNNIMCMSEISLPSPFLFYKNFLHIIMKKVSIFFGSRLYNYLSSLCLYLLKISFKDFHFIYLVNVNIYNTRQRHTY